MSLINNAYLSEKVKIDTVDFGYTSTSAVSRKFSMANYEKAAVIVTVGPYPSSALAGGGPLTASIVVGPSSQGESSFSELSGSTASFATATAGAVTKAQAVQFLLWSSAYTTAHNLTINGVNFNSTSTAANSSYKQWTINTIATAVAQSLSTLLATHLGSNIHTTYAGAGTAASVTIEAKDSSTYVTVVSTGQSTAGSGGVADSINIRPLRQQAIIEFTAADLVSTASSYTDFAVKLASSGAGASVVVKTAVVIRYNGDYSPTNFCSSGVPIKVGQSS